MRWSGSSFPVLSFLHVPGKMSQPLWLMMGTAFRVSPTFAVAGADATSSVVSEQARPLFLTAKHTFAPWDFTKNSADLKIPEEFRKARYVVGKMYNYASDTTGDAIAAESEELTLVSVHPNLDVALLSLRTWPPTSPAGRACAGAPALPLLPDDRILKSGVTGVIEGFRGMGRLGELDTFDPSLLQTLKPAERDSLMKEMQHVEGRQTRAVTEVRVLDPLGMCHGDGDAHTVCYHGMSGGALVIRPPSATEVTSNDDEGGTAPSYCAGILYGKHPDHPQSIGYTPANAFSSWLRENATRFLNAAA